MQCMMRKNSGCVMWTHNGTHCALIFKHQINSTQMLSGDIQAGSLTYTGFVECRPRHAEQRELIASYFHDFRKARNFYAKSFMKTRR